MPADCEDSDDYDCGDNTSSYNVTYEMAKRCYETFNITYDFISCNLKQNKYYLF